MGDQEENSSLTCLPGSAGFIELRINKSIGRLSTEIHGEIIFPSDNSPAVGMARGGTAARPFRRKQAF